MSSSGSDNNTIGDGRHHNHHHQDKLKLNLRREKNKIASRACRLKKKAQHEANKIKLHGLIQEHKQLVETIHMVRQLIKIRVREAHKLPADKKMVELFDEICNQKLRTKVAGNSDEYVHAALVVAKTANNTS